MTAWGGSRTHTALAGQGVRRGSTVLDVAERVHKDFAANLKFARLWGASRFDGQMVERSYVVKDNDLIEFHL